MKTATIVMVNQGTDGRYFRADAEGDQNNRCLSGETVHQLRKQGVGPLP